MFCNTWKNIAKPVLSPITKMLAKFNHFLTNQQSIWVLTFIKDPCDYDGIKVWHIALQSMAASHHGDSCHSYVVIDCHTLTGQSSTCGSLDIAPPEPAKIYVWSTRSRTQSGNMPYDRLAEPREETSPKFLC